MSGRRGGVMKLTDSGDNVMVNIKLIQGDCLEKMKDIPDGSVDLTVTSPPYDNLRTYNGTLNDWTQEKWQAIIRELFRVTKQGGVVVWIVGDATINGSETGTSFRQALWAMECGFRLHDTMIYQTNKPPRNCRRYQDDFEFMFVLSKGPPKTFNPLLTAALHPGVKNTGGQRGKDGRMRDRTYCNSTGETKLRGNIWYLPRSSKSGDQFSRQHPATFPESLARDHILSWSNEGDTVFDPFMGSGTTGKMAKLLNRNFIGIELDEGYFKIAQDRINQAVVNTNKRRVQSDGRTHCCQARECP